MFSPAQERLLTTFPSILCSSFLKRKYFC